jgi:hypothetical protein
MDATSEPTSTGPYLGRLINHGDRPKDRNCKLRVLGILNRPHLCFFATRDIEFGEQILYDYGVSVSWVRNPVYFQDKLLIFYVEHKHVTAVFFNTKFVLMQ